MSQHHPPYVPSASLSSISSAFAKKTGRSGENTLRTARKGRGAGGEGIRMGDVLGSGDVCGICFAFSLLTSIDLN